MRRVYIFGIRLLPGQTAEEFIPRVEQLVEDAGLNLADSPDVGSCTVEFLNNSPAFGTPVHDPFLQAVLKIAEADEAGGVGYASDAGRLEALGCTCVVFGPGDISVAHKPNEWIPIDEFERAPKLMHALIEGMC